LTGTGHTYWPIAWASRSNGGNRTHVVKKLVGNYPDQDFSILKVEGTNVTDTGKRFKVPGHPASARMSMR
jgi:hypothetical protein